MTARRPGERIAGPAHVMRAHGQGAGADPPKLRNAVNHQHPRYASPGRAGQSR
jgi:hypothetical protein